MNSIQASEVKKQAFKYLDTTLILSKGQHQEIILSKNSKFSVSNKEILSYNHDAQRGKLLIKGKMVGFSEVIIWNKNKKLTHKVYVLSKNGQLKLIHLKEIFQALKLQTKILGPYLLVSGELDTLSDYLLFHKTILKQDNKLQLKVTLSKKLKRLIATKIYSAFWDKYIDTINCKLEGAKFHCEIKNDSKTVNKLINKYKTELFISFLKIGNEKTENLLVKLKIIQIEQLDGNELNFGLSKIDSSVENIFSQGVTSLISNNQVLLKNENVDITTLAEPSGRVKVGEKMLFEIGADLPYKSTSSLGTSNTDWKFAGLKFTLNFKKEGDTLYANLESQFTRPTKEGAISGNKQKSTLYIDQKRPVQIFQVLFKTINNREQSLPLLSSIPLLGNLFKSKGKMETYKKVYALIEVKKEYVK